MEELDDLKILWKQDRSFEQKNENEIALMIRGSSKTLITKLKRSVWIELSLSVLCIVALGAFGLSLSPGAMMWTIMALLVLLLGYVFYYVKKIILLNDYDDSAENLKTNLENLVDKLDAYMTFYKRSYAILYPLFFLLGLFFGIMESGLDRFVQKMQNPLNVFAFLLIAVIFMVGVYAITDWYLKKLYGNHIEKLRSLLLDLKHMGNND
ncbi:MAG: hypothetical protein MUE95_01255 [Cyclobacteriaceae bacterium]|jgi:Ca2+/Na+ antiporter|nr:hypothetical protein [Cyclobacteriaceae bacterium]